jgi:acyl-CoA synthetase (AMP-forming)/AMP-acid ligase II
MAGVPPLWCQLMHGLSPFPTMQFPGLRYITNSGGVLPKETLSRYRRMLPETKVFLMYGLTEAFRSTYLPPDEIDRRPDSIGKAIPETDLYVVDEQDRECEPGQVGELVHRGPTVTLGYWQDPEATAAVFRPHPFGGQTTGERVVYSGDLVKKDEEGYLYFVGRRDYMIKSQGFRTNPEEVEEIILSSRLVREVAVSWQSNDGSGALIVAHVVPLDQATCTTEALLSYCRRVMPRYMVPSSIRFHNSLPRTSSGKLDRKSFKPS